MKPFIFVCLALFLFASLFLLGCSEKSSPTAAPVPTMTGRWDYTVTGSGGSMTGLLDLTESNGSLSGTLILANDQLPINGTVTNSLQVTLGGSSNTGHILITATTNHKKDAFNGRMEIWTRTGSIETYAGSLTMTATKR
jgi:outer membrane lipoprotein-sorting protein